MVPLDLQIRVNDRCDGLNITWLRIELPLLKKGIQFVLGLLLVFATSGKFDLVSVELDHPPSGLLMEPRFGGMRHL